MNTAYTILSVTEDADDNTIKHAYLEKVKQFPPELASAEFHHIQTAYEAIKDAGSRCKYRLFHLPETDFQHFLQYALDCDPYTEADGANLVRLIESYNIVDTP